MTNMGMFLAPEDARGESSRSRRATRAFRTHTLHSNGSRKNWRDGDTKLVAVRKAFVLAGGNGFRRSDHIYFYTEVYESALNVANPPTLSMEYRVIERNTGEVKQDSGMAGIASYVHPGNTTIPFATVLPVAKLEPGLYRLELRATHSSGVDVVNRNVDFEVR